MLLAAAVRAEGHASRPSRPSRHTQASTLGEPLSRVPPIQTTTGATPLQQPAARIPVRNHLVRIPLGAPQLACNFSGDSVHRAGPWDQPVGHMVTSTVTCIVLFPLKETSSSAVCSSTLVTVLLL